MIPLGLTKAELDKLVAALRDSHRMRVKVAILNADEKPVGYLTGDDKNGKVIGGAVQVDSTADVTRSLSLDLIDERHELRFDKNNPGAGSLFADNFITVQYGVYVGSLSTWIDIPVFWGPVTRFQRSGAEVTVEAQGKESLALDPHFATTGFTISKHTRLDTAIKRVMNRMGERRYSLAAVGDAKLSKHRSLTAQSQPWLEIVGGAEDKNGKKKPSLLSYAKRPMRGFYDGAGRLRVVRANREPVHAFRETDLSGRPQVAYAVEEVINHVVVTGATPKGGKVPVRGSASLQAPHPFSPAVLARNGERRFMTAFVDAPNAKTNEACRARARDELARRSREVVDVSFECLPFPLLEEYDEATLATDEYRMAFPVKQFTIPLSSDSLMSVGTLKRPKRRRGRNQGRR